MTFLLCSAAQLSGMNGGDAKKGTFLGIVTFIENKTTVFEQQNPAIVKMNKFLIASSEKQVSQQELLIDVKFYIEHTDISVLPKFDFNNSFPLLLPKRILYDDISGDMKKEVAFTVSKKPFVFTVMTNSSNELVQNLLNRNSELERINHQLNKDYQGTKEINDILENQNNAVNNQCNVHSADVQKVSAINLEINKQIEILKKSEQILQSKLASWQPFLLTALSVSGAWVIVFLICFKTRLVNVC